MAGAGGGAPRWARALGALVASLVSTAALAGPTQVARMDGADRCVALTFDDGPDPAVTPRILSTLEAKGAKASFFVVGFRAEIAPDVVQRADRAGFDVGNHTFHHAELTKLSSSAALAELTTNDALITQLIGHAPVFTRAPYGSLSYRVANLSARKYVAWSVDTNDWRYFDAARLKRVVLSEAVNGGIILMHDLYPTTADALPDIIDGLRGKGFRLVTLSDLLGGACGGKPIGYDLVGDAPVASAAPAPTTAVVARATALAPSSAPAPKLPAAAPVQPISVPVEPRRYKVNDNDE